jgi:hypothetical protein
LPTAPSGSARWRLDCGRWRSPTGSNSSQRCQLALCRDGVIEATDHISGRKPLGVFDLANEIWTDKHSPRKGGL